MRWILVVLLMCNGIYFLWQSYLQQGGAPNAVSIGSVAGMAGDRLQLLSELEEGRGSEIGSALAVSESVVTSVSEQKGGEVEQLATPDTPAGICWLIGPFNEKISGKQVVNRLAALDISLSLHAIEIPGKTDYWVHLPPQLSRKAASTLLRELQGKKIDSFLITEGELANGISLGFFTSEARAQRVHDERREQGYDARIKLVSRSHSELWAIFDQGEYGKFSEPLWRKIQQGNKGLERRKNYCDKIASIEKFD